MPVLHDLRNLAMLLAGPGKRVTLFIKVSSVNTFAGLSQNLVPAHTPTPVEKRPASIVRVMYTSAAPTLPSVKYFTQSRVKELKAVKPPQKPTTVSIYIVCFEAGARVLVIRYPAMMPMMKHPTVLIIHTAVPSHAPVYRMDSSMR